MEKVLGDSSFTMTNTKCLSDFPLMALMFIAYNAICGHEKRLLPITVVARLLCFFIFYILVKYLNEMVESLLSRIFDNAIVNICPHFYDRPLLDTFSCSMSQQV